MNRKLMRVFVSILLLSTFVAAFCFLTGCDSGSKGGDKVAVSKVYLTEKPQLTFVLGNEPDFSAGKLAVERENGSLESVALTDEGVEITGYDKNTLGEQSVTFSYGGKATTMKVTVVRRMVFKGLTVKYFMGDAFDKSAGSIKVTTDDGKTANVNMSDESVSVEGFNANAVGTQNVTVRYTDGGNSYTDTVSVQVYEVGSVKFTAPGKLTYKSHDTELKINDGYFIVTAKDDPTLTKPVSLTRDMIVKDFDPSVATRENLESAITQEVEVEYLGNTFTFQVTITYSGVSLMLDAIESLKELNWENSIPTYTEEQGEIALEAVQYYLDMTTAEREFIDEEEAKQIVKLAAVYGSEKYIVLLDEFDDAFDINYEMGTISMTGKSFEGVNTVANRLNDPSDELLVLGSLLNKIIQQYGGMTLEGNTTIQNSVFVLNDNIIVVLKEICLHMVKLHKDLADIPAEWTVESLADYSGHVSAAVRHMDAATFGQYTNYVMLCDQVSSWREHDDYLDIIYTYYIHYMEQDAFATDLWQRQVPLPGDIQELYSLIANGVTIINQFAAGGAVVWMDTTTFLLLYDQTLELSNKIATGEDGLYKDIYNFVDFPQMISLYLSNAFRTFCNSLYGDAEFENMYGVYLTVIKHMIADGEEYDANNYLQERQDLIDIFAALSPAKQKAFLGTVNYLYHAEKVNDYMLLDFSEGESRSYLIHLMVDFMLQQGLSKELVTTTVNDLFLAMEYYLNTDRYTTAKQSFMDKMDGVTKAYAKLEGEEKALFDRLLGKVYSRYTAIYNYELKDGQNVVLGDAEALFEELNATYGQLQTVLELVNNSETDQKVRDKAMVLVFAAYEKCERLAKQITATTDYDVLGTYYSVKYQITEKVSGTMDDALVYYRDYFINYLLNASLGVMDPNGNVTLQPTWNLYVKAEHISGFMADASDMLYAIINGETVTPAMLEKVKASIGDLTADELALFRVLAGAENYVTFIEYVLSDALDPMMAKMQAIVVAHLEYSFATEEEMEAKGAAFKAAVEDAAALAESLAENEEYKTYVKPMYDQFVTIVNAMNNSTEQEAA